MGNKKENTLAYTRSDWRIVYDEEDIIIDHNYESSKGDVICSITGGRGTPEDEANASLIAAAPDMEHALRSFIAGMEGKESFPGHNQAYLEQVCLPRAKAALIKAKII